jgi:hypothetical protein
MYVELKKPSSVGHRLAKKWRENGIKMTSKWRQKWREMWH